MAADRGTDGEYLHLSLQMGELLFHHGRNGLRVLNTERMAEETLTVVIRPLLGAR